VLTYIAVLVVVAAVLYVSFRALSGGEPVAAEDYRTALVRIAGFVTDRAQQIEPLIAQVEAEPPGDVASVARKALSGYQQTLSALEADVSGSEREVLVTARSLLSAAIEDYGWACRMLETGNHRDNLGVQRAIAALCEHGSECLRSATAVLREPQGVESR
jgi:hypothetical protein